jgi:hypothetical protein
MTLRLAALVGPVMAVAVTGCGAPTCGPGTQLEDGQCVAGAKEPEDAGAVHGDGGASSLPITAIIRPMTVMQGFAVCPTITMGFADGRSSELVLDPTYGLPALDRVQIDRAGFSVSWSSPDGRTSSAKLPRCQGAVVGQTPGTSMVSLVVSDGRQSRTIGTAPITIVPFGGGTTRGVMIESPERTLNITEQGLGAGEARQLLANFELVFPPNVAPTIGTLAVPSALTFESSAPDVVSVSPTGEALAMRAGSSVLTSYYSVAGQRLAATGSTIMVSDSQIATSIIFTLPRSDDGFLLPDVNRRLDFLARDQCVSTSAWALLRGPGGQFLRRLDQTTALSAVDVLERRGTQRFCASALGHGAIRGCGFGLCRIYPTLVTDETRPPTLQATIAPTEFATGAFGRQRVCADLRVTATWASGAAVDVSDSFALLFGSSFQNPSATPMTALLDDSTGLVQRQQGKVCFEVEIQSGRPDAAFRVFYAGGQAELKAKVHF